MAANIHNSGAGRRSPWRVARWITAGLLLLLPSAVMQFIDEVNWNETDFIVFGIMLVGACGSYEMAMRMARNTAYRAAAEWQLWRHSS